MELGLFSPAKVNLGLSILHRRPDQYHQLHTLFLALDQGDTLYIEPDRSGITLTVEGAQLPTGSDNLVYRAAQAYLEASNCPRGVRIHLVKRLPVAAGLGGGSSNAATTLLGLARLYPAAIDLPLLARSLGADVPFFLQPGLAEGQGIGELLEPRPVPDLWLVLLNPGLAVAASLAYRHLEPPDWDPPLPIATTLTALAQGSEPPYWNTLEKPVFRLFPQLAQLRDALREVGLQGVLMSGSGSTLLGLAPSQSQAEQTAQVLAERYPQAWVRVAGVYRQGQSQL